MLRSEGEAALGPQTRFLTRNTELSFRLPWWLLVGSFGAVMVICAIASVFSIWKVLKLEPAVVFK